MPNAERVGEERWYSSTNNKSSYRNDLYINDQTITFILLRQFQCVSGSLLHSMAYYVCVVIIQIKTSIATNFPSPSFVSFTRSLFRQPMNTPFYKTLFCLLFTSLAYFCLAHFGFLYIQRASWTYFICVHLSPFANGFCTFYKCYA